MTRIERWIIAGLTVMTGCFMASLIVTSSWWFSLNRLAIHDARYGQPIQIEYDREFRRDFTGEWVVAIWKSDRGEWAAYCAAGGEWPYKRAHPKQTKTLDWLIGESAWCLPMGPGQYRAELTVTANPGTIISRSQTIISNVFEVTP